MPNFAILMKEWGVDPPNFSESPGDLDMDWFKWFLDSLGKGRKGTSTLHKWTCPECGLKVRIGIKGNPEIRHNPCELKSGHPVFFVQADGLSHTIFKNEK